MATPTCTPAAHSPVTSAGVNPPALQLLPSSTLLHVHPVHCGFNPRLPAGLLVLVHLITLKSFYLTDDWTLDFLSAV